MLYFYPYRCISPCWLLHVSDLCRNQCTRVNLPLGTHLFTVLSVRVILIILKIVVKIRWIINFKN